MAKIKNVANQKMNDNSNELSLRNRVHILTMNTMTRALTPVLNLSMLSNVLSKLVFCCCNIHMHCAHQEF